jgi:hypothetical protein
VPPEEINIKQEILHTKRDMKTLGEPKSSGWDAIGPAAEYSQSQGQVVDSVARTVMQRDTADKAANKIASSYVSLNREL